jgi:nucleotide-binding universal stress UspA family protein
MEKHLLLTVRDDKQITAPLRFTQDFFNNLCDLRLTLLYVVTLGGLMGADESDHSPEAELDKKIVEAKKAKGREALAYAKDWIVGRGCEAAKVETKMVFSGEGVAPAIVVEARKGLYDTVFLGSRGLSWFEEMVEDSVSQRLLWEEIDFPVWCCRHADLIPRDNVLLCVLGTEADTRMADHVGFMLEGEARHRVKLFHVADRDMSPLELDELVRPHKQKLMDNGFPGEMIDTGYVVSKNVEKAIVGEAEAGRFAVVAVGRQQGEPTGLKRFFPDSLSGRLLKSVENACLWVSK